MNFVANAKSLFLRLKRCRSTLALLRDGIGLDACTGQHINSHESCRQKANRKGSSHSTTVEPDFLMCSRKDDLNDVSALGSERDFTLAPGLK